MRKITEFPTEQEIQDQNGASFSFQITENQKRYTVLLTPKNKGEGFDAYLIPASNFERHKFRLTNN